MAREAVVVEETPLGRFRVEARAGSTVFLIDAPVAFDGLGSGPNPFDLLSEALGDCPGMTLQLYAERKAWPLSNVRVRVEPDRGDLQAHDTFSLDGEIEETQRARRMQIARC